MKNQMRLADRVDDNLARVIHYIIMNHDNGIPATEDAIDVVMRAAREVRIGGGYAS